MKTKPGVMLYFENLLFMDRLSESQRGRMFSAIIEYARDGETPMFCDPMLEMAWDFVQPGLDRDEARYQAICEKNRRNAEKRWKLNATACDRMPNTTSNTTSTQIHLQHQQHRMPENEIEREMLQKP